MPKPINDATPHDKRILLYGGKAGYNADDQVEMPVVVGWYDAARSKIDERDFWRFCSYDSGWYGEYENPTHWQELPL